MESKHPYRVCTGAEVARHSLDNCQTAMLSSLGELTEAVHVQIKCRGPSTPQLHSQANGTAPLRMTLVVDQRGSNLSATAAQSPAFEFRLSLRQSCTASRRDKTSPPDNP